MKPVFEEEGEASIPQDTEILVYGPDHPVAGVHFDFNLDIEGFDEED